jgi:hypothetical protein
MVSHSSFAQSILLISFLCFIGVIASSSEQSPTGTYLKHQLRALQEKPKYKSQNATNGDISKAQKLVAEAIAQQGRYNTYRVDNPIRNSYASRNSVQAKGGKRSKGSRPSPPSFNSTVRAAARLLAERDAAAQHLNGTLHKIYSKPDYLATEDTPHLGKRAPDTYWLEKMTHTGRSPMGGDPDYMV